MRITRRQLRRLILEAVSDEKINSEMVKKAKQAVVMAWRDVYGTSPEDGYVAPTVTKKGEAVPSLGNREFKHEEDSIVFAIGTDIKQKENWSKQKDKVMSAINKRLKSLGLASMVATATGEGHRASIQPRLNFPKGLPNAVYISIILK